MSIKHELEPEAVFTGMASSLLPFKTTDEVEILEEIIGQGRAIDAIEQGVEVNKAGFNLFALGPSGIGKQSTIMQYLDTLAEFRDAPSDWCYVNNFEQPHLPYALQLPTGKGQELHNDMNNLIDDSRTSIPVAFESDEYRHKLAQIQETYETRRTNAITMLSDEAAAGGVALVKGSHGFILGPIVEGKVIDAKEFSKRPKKEQDRIQEAINSFEEKLSILL